MCCSDSQPRRARRHSLKAQARGSRLLLLLLFCLLAHCACVRTHAHSTCVPYSSSDHVARSSRRAERAQIDRDAPQWVCLRFSSRLECAHCCLVTVASHSAATACVAHVRRAADVEARTACVSVGRERDAHTHNTRARTLAPLCAHVLVCLCALVAAAHSCFSSAQHTSRRRRRRTKSHG